MYLIPMKPIMAFLALCFVHFLVTAQWQLRAGAAYGTALNTDLVFSDTGRSRTFLPDEKLSGSMILVPFGFGVSTAGQMLEAGISAAYSNQVIEGDGSKNRINMLVPAAYLDMYFLDLSPWMMGGSIQVRYTAFNLRRMFIGNYDGQPGPEVFDADMRWSGLGYKIALTGKYQFNEEDIAIQFSTGYVFDSRQLRSLELDGTPVAFDDGPNGSRLAIDGLEFQLALLIALDKR